MESVAVALRYFLIAAGAFVVARGYATSDTWAQFMSAWDALIGGVLAIAPIVWGFYVNWNTKRVTAEQAKSRKLATVSPITGQMRKPSP